MKISFYSLNNHLFVFIRGKVTVAAVVVSSVFVGALAKASEPLNRESSSKSLSQGETSPSSSSSVSGGDSGSLGGNSGGAEGSSEGSSTLGMPSMVAPSGAKPTATSSSGGSSSVRGSDEQGATSTSGAPLSRTSKQTQVITVSPIEVTASPPVEEVDPFALPSGASETLVRKRAELEVQYEQQKKVMNSIRSQLTVKDFDGPREAPRKSNEIISVKGTPSDGVEGIGHDAEWITALDSVNNALTEKEVEYLLEKEAFLSESPNGKFGQKVHIPANQGSESISSGMKVQEGKSKSIYESNHSTHGSQSSHVLGAK